MTLQPLNTYSTVKGIEKSIEELGQIPSRPDDRALVTRDMVWLLPRLFQKRSFGARCQLQSTPIARHWLLIECLPQTMGRKLHTLKDTLI